jgi:nucleotide-binding universal stress UspA family protein
LAAVRRILVATDRSESAGRAVAWAAEMASLYRAELVLLQVLTPETAASAETAGSELERLAQSIDDGVRASVVVDPDPSAAIVRASEKERVDVLVVGNVGMSGRREFLLANVPNRVSHNARCTVVIVNTTEPPRRGRLGRRR